MDEIVNLYSVQVGDEPYGYYVFTSTPNKARYLCVRRNSDNEEYICLRAYIMKKNVGGVNNIVVEYLDDDQYQRVTDAGCSYIEEEEEE